MSGHSHWAGIKHKKAANDAKRGKVWSKIARVIIVAAKAAVETLDKTLRCVTRSIRLNRQICLRIQLKRP